MEKRKKWKVEKNTAAAQAYHTEPSKKFVSPRKIAERFLKKYKKALERKQGKSRVNKAMPVTEKLRI